MPRFEVKLHVFSQLEYKVTHSDTKILSHIAGYII